MSLTTLLEAAEFLDGDPRVEKTEDLHAYAKSSRSPRKRTDSGLNNNDQNDDEMSEDGKEKRRAGGAGTRETHNKLEKNRRAHLKDCFELLKEHIPNMEDKKSSNLSILRSSLKYIQVLKRKEKEFEQDMLRLAHEKIGHQENILSLKNDLNNLNIDFDLNSFVQAIADQDNDTNSTSTASEGCSPIVSEDEDIFPGSGSLKRKIAPKGPSTRTSATTSVNTFTGSKVAAGRPRGTKSFTSLAPIPIPIPIMPQKTVKTQVAQLLQRQISQRALAQQQQKEALKNASGQQQAGAIQQQMATIQPAVLTIPNPGIPRATTFTIPASSVRLPFHIQEVISKAVTSGDSAPVVPVPGTLTKVTTASNVVKVASSVAAPVHIKTEPGLSIANTASIVKPQGIYTLVANTNQLKLETIPATSHISTVTTPVSMLSAGQLAGISSQSANNPNFKQIIGPGTQFLAQGNSLAAIGQMVQQAIAQQQQQLQLQQAKSIKASACGTVSLPATGTQVVGTIPQGVASASTMANLAQILAPITVMTPTVVQLNQATMQPQLNNVQQSFIKSVGTIPTLLQQPSFLQQTQVMGQQVFKPMIMVTMPTMVAANVASPSVTSIPATSGQATVQLAVSVPKSTS